MGVALALICVIATNPIRVSKHCVRRYLTAIVIKSSCTRVTRRSASVIKVGVAYLNIHISTHLKEELVWIIDKQLQVIRNKMLFKTVVPLRN